MSSVSAPSAGKAYDLEAELERLHHSIDSLAGVVTSHGQKLDEISARQTSDFRELLSKVHDTYKELVGLQRKALDDFGDRLDQIVARQETSASTIRSEMRTDFSRIVDRQDSHFRWLFGVIVASAISVGIAIYRTH